MVGRKPTGCNTTIYFSYKEAGNGANKMSFERRLVDRLCETHIAMVDGLLAAVLYHIASGKVLTATYARSFYTAR